jgi:hypothetical protein
MHIYFLFSGTNLEMSISHYIMCMLDSVTFTLYMFLWIFYLIYIWYSITVIILKKLRFVNHIRNHSFSMWLMGGSSSKSACLPSKCETLSLNPSATKKKKKKLRFSLFIFLVSVLLPSHNMWFLICCSIKSSYQTSDRSLS